MIKAENIELIVNSFFDPKILINQKNYIFKDILFFLKENKILIRFNDLLIKHNISLNINIERDCKKELERIRHNRKMINAIAKSLKNYQKNLIFFKNFQHIPDMGDDIDIMVLNNYLEIKNKLIKDFSLVEKKQTIFNRLASKCMLIDKHNGIEIELHNGRLGRFGEFKCSDDIINLCKTEEEYGVYVPSQEFQLIINIIQRLYTRSYIRISEILFLKLNLSSNFNWKLAERIAYRFGIVKGMDFYVKIINSLFVSDSNKNKFFTLESAHKAVHIKKSLLYLNKFQTASFFILKLINLKKKN